MTPFGSPVIGGQKPSPEENSCIPITHFQCKTHFEHLLVLTYLRSYLSTFQRLQVPSSPFPNHLTSNGVRWLSRRSANFRWSTEMRREPCFFVDCSESVTVRQNFFGCIRISSNHVRCSPYFSCNDRGMASVWAWRVKVKMLKFA